MSRPKIKDTEIIERFGGIRPMAGKLGVAVTTVQGWKVRGHIPENRMPDILRAAREHGIELGETDSPAAPAQAVPEKPAVAPEPARPAAVETLTGAKVEPEPELEAETKPEPEKEPQAQAETKPVASREARAGVSWAALAVVVLLLAGGLLTRPFWEPQLYPRADDGSVVVRDGRLDEALAGLADVSQTLERLQGEMDTRIDALEAGGGEAGEAFAAQLAAVEQSLKQTSGELAALRASLDGLDGRLARIEAAQGRVPDAVRAELQRIDQAVAAVRGDAARLAEGLQRQEAAARDGRALLGASLSGLEGRVTELETRPVQTGEKIAALALAIGQVEEALRSGRPYREELDRLAAIGGDDPLIVEGTNAAALSAWADRGIPNRAGLVRQFNELAPGISRALASSPEGGWLESAWDSVAGLVTVRRIEGSDGLSPVSKAEAALADGDLAGALDAFAGSGSLGTEGDSWRILVEARIEAESRLRTLHGQVIAPLAASQGSTAR